MHAGRRVILFPILLMACGPSPRAPQPPVLEFPEPGVDDPAAYEGYATRFFRDSRGNTFQVYLNRAAGRVVHVWADAANESAAFTVRDVGGGVVPLWWEGTGAEVASDGPARSVAHRIAAGAAEIEIGGFLLGTMRQERDFQYSGRHRRPLGDPPFVLPELAGLVSALERLPDEERAAHLALLDAPDVDGLRARLRPHIALTASEGDWMLRVEQATLDGQHRLALELGGDGGMSAASLEDGRVAVRALSGDRIEIEVTVTTDAEPLTPLGRDRLFNAAFERHLATRRAAADSLRAALSPDSAARDPRLIAFRRLERQAIGLELLSSEEKLLASMPNYATYFGRDQMMSALMLEPVSSVDVQELVIASVLRKLHASGNVSHEEALGGQAIRERAAEYAGLVREWESSRERDPDAAARSLAAARALLGDLQAVRENYRMVDDDFQLPVLVARYLTRADVPDARKRAFLAEPARVDAATGTSGSIGTRLDALARNLAFVAALARPYAEEPLATNLVGFSHEDEEGPLPGSWRDSRAGYGNGRFAMDVNAIWVPEALAAIERIAAILDSLGTPLREAADRLETAPVLGEYLDDPAPLRAAVATWRGARHHFAVRLEPTEIRASVEAMLAQAPNDERAFWRARLDAAELRPLSFLALALDDAGRPIPAASTDPATALFLGDHSRDVLAGTADPGAVLSMLDVLSRPYPVGVLVEGLGPVVVNDAYADRSVQRRFREDAYHSPRVVWGREVNLILLGLARQIDDAHDADGGLRSRDGAFRRYVDALRATLERTSEAVEASGLGHNELWSYRIEDGTLRPVRYGQSSDLQLWNVTDLAVTFLLDRLPPP